MKRFLDKRNNYGIIWQARTRNFTINLEVEQVFGFEYDGDDEDGETQAALNSGDLIAFDSRVVVYRDDVELGSDSLGSSVYKDGETHTFLQSGYFTDMLNEACRQARETLNEMPKLRNVA